MTLAIDMSAWGWPQWTMLGLDGFVLLLNAFYDGQPKNQNYSFGVALIALGASLFILASGGFFWRPA